MWVSLSINLSCFEAYCLYQSELIRNGALADCARCLVWNMEGNLRWNQDVNHRDVMHIESHQLVRVT